MIEIPAKKSIEKRKLASLLGDFSDLELKRLMRFLKSPYHNNNQQVVKLLAWLRKYKLAFDSPNLTEAAITRQLFGKRPVKAEELQAVYSKLSRLVEDFLITEQLKRQPRWRKKQLIEVWSNRNYKHFKRETLQLIEALQNQVTYKTEKDYLLLYQLQHQLWFHEETEKLTNDQTALLQSQIDLDHFYQLQKLQFAAVLAGRANFLNTETEGLLQELKSQFLNNANFEYAEYKLLYQLICQLHLSGKVADYQTLKTKVKAVFPLLSKDHQINLLVHLVNFVIQYRLSKSELSERDIFELYQLGVEHQLFLEKGKMRDIEFTNICIAGFLLEETDWTRQFIEEQGAYLPIEKQDIVLPFVQAYGAFFSGEFEKVIELLRQVRPDHQLTYYCRIKSLLIRAYFECVLNDIGTYDRSLPYELEAFKKLMERNKKNTAIRTQAYLNFIAVTRKLIPLLKEVNDRGKFIKKIRKMLDKTKPIIFKAWLVEKFKALEEVAPQQP